VTLALSAKQDYEKKIQHQHAIYIHGRKKNQTFPKKKLPLGPKMSGSIRHMAWFEARYRLVAQDRWLLKAVTVRTGLTG
jgi:hypothetical protein